MVTYIKKAKLREPEESAHISRQVSEILSQIKTEGDEALIRLNKKYDNYEGGAAAIPKEAIKRAYSLVSENVTENLVAAARNIRKFASEQKSIFKDIEAKIKEGVTLGHSVIPVESCACYVPGGRYPLASSALMSVIPAKAAGVKRIVCCSPKSKAHEFIHPAVLVAMDIAGADEIYCMGGAQAIGALAYGTQSIKNVNLIVGPGSQYVTEAKRQVYGTVNIDFLAGPSEVVIIADDSGNADFIAADILAQSEHDPQSSGILITTSEKMAKDVIASVEYFLDNLATKEIAKTAWNNNGEVIICESLKEAAQISNELAPEHLEIQVCEPDILKKMLYNYGSLFIGNYSAEVFGDYSSGTNHILPTAKSAKYTGGVWIGTFLKVMTYQRITKEGAKQIGKTASALAGLEGLTAHGLAADLRL